MKNLKTVICVSVNLAVSGSSSIVNYSPDDSCPESVKNLARSQLFNQHLWCDSITMGHVMTQLSTKVIRFY